MPDLDSLLDELAEHLARMARLKAQGIRPAQVRAAVVELCWEVCEMEEES